MREQDYLSGAIRAARRRAGLSQAELAAALGVRQSSVSQWERGSTRPSTDHLLALTSVLHCTLLDFSAVGAVGAAGEGPANPDPAGERPATGRMAGERPAKGRMADEGTATGRPAGEDPADRAAAAKTTESVP
jgi:HTH-type transcriptional regulator/antitoxin HipB